MACTRYAAQHQLTWRLTSSTPYTDTLRCVAPDCATTVQWTNHGLYSLADTIHPMHTTYLLTTPRLYILHLNHSLLTNLQLSLHLDLTYVLIYFLTYILHLNCTYLLMYTLHYDRTYLPTNTQSLGLQEILNT